MTDHTNSYCEHDITQPDVSSCAYVAANNNSNGILQHQTKQKYHPARISKHQQRKLPAASDIDQTTTTANDTATSDARNINGHFSINCNKCHKSFHNYVPSCQVPNL